MPLPDGLMMMVPDPDPAAGRARALLGWPTKIRMGLEWFRAPARAAAADRSVADFIREHYGQEAVDYLAEPLLSGVYGGDPEALSVASVLPRFVELASALRQPDARRAGRARKAARRAGRQPRRCSAR